MYNMKSDTYSCDICGFEMGWEESDDVHGELWGCEKCGATFCTECFVKAVGRNGYDNMMRGCDLVLCPECYRSACKEEADHENAN